MGRDGARTRRRVLDAVGTIVAARGLEGIRVREIAAEAGMSPGSVLYHFPDQSELLLAVHRDTVHHYLAGRARAAKTSSTDAIGRLLAVMHEGVPPWANEHVIRLLYGLHDLARRSSEHADLLTDLWRSERELYAGIVRAGVDEGSFRVTDSPEEVAAGLLALEDGLVLHLISNNREVTSDQVVALFASVTAARLGCPQLIDRIGRGQ